MNQAGAGAMMIYKFMLHFSGTLKPGGLNLIFEKPAIFMFYGYQYHYRNRFKYRPTV